MKKLKFNHVDLGEVNKNYNKKKSLLIVDIILLLYILSMLSYLIFSIIFIKAQVIGISMQPLFNSKLEPSLTSSEYEKSIYQDVAYVNRFEKGKNGDIILLEIAEVSPNGISTNIIIKRMIASEGQRVTLRRESNGFYYYYVSDDPTQIGDKLNEPYVSDENRKGMDINYFNSFEKNASSITDVTEDGMGAYFVVPRGKVFVLGDNRPSSKDSHIFGCVETSKILGKVAFYYSYNENLFSYIWKQFCSIL